MQRFSPAGLPDACHPSVSCNNSEKVLVKFRKAVDMMVRYDTVVSFASYCKWMC